MDRQLNDEAALDPSSDQLLCFIDEEALLNEAQIKGDLIHAVQILVEHEKFEILGAREVQMELFAVTEARYLSPSFAKALWL